jgi:hypothetical protein
MSWRFVMNSALSLFLSGACFAQHYTQTNLVSDTAGVAPVNDPQLTNPWGLSRSSSSAWWVADNVAGVSTLYNGAGSKQALVVSIPVADPNNKKVPTGPSGTVSNGNPSEFLLEPGKQACSSSLPLMEQSRAGTQTLQ